MTHLILFTLYYVIHWHIIEFLDGLDFFFATKQDGKHLVDFLQAVVPIRCVSEVYSIVTCVHSIDMKQNCTRRLLTQAQSQDV